jgi:sorbitol-6-phosphate 2-dehydrogenase
MMAPDRIEFLINTIGPALRGLWSEGGALAVVRFDDSGKEGPADGDGDAWMFWEPPELAPAAPIVKSLRTATERHQREFGALPRMAAVPGVGLFIAVPNPAAGRGGRVAGKVAVVTGAAQGFGQEIAEAFAAEGGVVALTDINADGAKAAAGEICRRQGAGRAIGLFMDVTRGESVAACVHEVVRTFGGFDVLISNAGVLKAESVKTQSEKDFEFVTAVKYKGDFCCVQKAAPILAVQHLARPEYMSDIIQINSKSGLQGSNRNGAYSGSKFGGIGLTQSFAMELIEDGIKVNAICPGNFFDGPLWSDPETGLFAQYLRTGKVPGAKTVADVKKFYEAKVPMGRGCTTADVMKAVFYVIEQKYETGQAVPVTGGQVMLS